MSDEKLTPEQAGTMPHCCEHEHYCDDDDRHFHTCCGHWHGRDRMTEKLRPELAVSILRNKAEELEADAKMVLQEPGTIVSLQMAHLAADIALVASLLADHMEQPIHMIGWDDAALEGNPRNPLDLPPMEGDPPTPYTVQDMEDDGDMG